MKMNTPTIAFFKKKKKIPLSVLERKCKGYAHTKRYYLFLVGNVL